MLLVQGAPLFLTTLPAFVLSGEVFVRSIFCRLKDPVSQDDSLQVLGGRKMPSSPFPALPDLSPFPLSGQLCETPPRPAAPRSPCEGTECQNGANCVDQGSRPVCQCLPGFGGPECEKLLSVNFVDRDTYLQFTDLQNWPRANITLQVGAQGAGHQGESGGGGPRSEIQDTSLPRTVGRPLCRSESLDMGASISACSSSRIGEVVGI